MPVELKQGLAQGDSVALKGGSGVAVDSHSRSGSGNVSGGVDTNVNADAGVGSQNGESESFFSDPGASLSSLSSGFGDILPTIVHDDLPGGIIAKGDLLEKEGAAAPGDGPSRIQGAGEKQGLGPRDNSGDDANAGAHTGVMDGFLDTIGLGSSSTPSNFLPTFEFDGAEMGDSGARGVHTAQLDRTNTDAKQKLHEARNQDASLKLKAPANSANSEAGQELQSSASADSDSQWSAGQFFASFFGGMTAALAAFGLVHAVGRRHSSSEETEIPDGGGDAAGVKACSISFSTVCF